MEAWILIVYLQQMHGDTIKMQEFSSQATCQAAGARIYEFSTHKALWSCIKK